MNRVPQRVFAGFLLSLLASLAKADRQSLLKFEKPSIDKIVQFSAIENSAILFTVGDYIMGYAEKGKVEWIPSLDIHETPACGWPHPALSHDGLLVAFVAENLSQNKTTEHCRILLYDIRTKTQRQLIETSEDPGEISWSWDDSEIAFFDHGYSAVSVRSGSKRPLVAFPRKISGDEASFWVWYPMQWLHNNKELVVELLTEIPTKEAGTYVQQGNVLLLSAAEARLIDIGSTQPSVSPVSDRIAYYASEGVVAINPDGSGRKVLTKTPRTLLFFKDDLFGRIVWSPDGKRLFFGTLVSDNRNDDVYLLEIKSGHRKKFLSGSSITIRGWH